MNTHDYDGKLDFRMLREIENVKNLPLEEKKDRGISLLRFLKHNAIANNYLSKIINCMGTSSNIDPTNNLVADDLICLCWTLRENPDFISILETQLMDMATGFCPQGRTHRLFQTIIAFQK